MAEDLLSLDQITELANRLAPPPNVTVDQTPANSGWLGRNASLLGEVLGGGAGPAGKALSPREKEMAGYQALARFGTGLMQASHYQPGQTIFSNLGQGFQAAQDSFQQSGHDAAALLAAQQNMQMLQNKQRLEAIKDALPLLQLQQQMRGAAEAGRLLGDNTSTGAGGSVGTAGDYTVPAELLPAYKVAAEKYGVPVELLIAQHKQESNLNPGATGGAGEVGLGQILPATAKSPGFGMAGADPKALRDPAANIDFSARYLAARAKAAGADLRTPEGVTKALKAYNGGGDPDYVGHVLRYVPGAQKALAGGAPAPGQAAVAPAASPGAGDPNAKVQIPPAAAPAAPGQATMPPPEPPLLAGTAQMAGPGGPTGTVIPPSPPGSDATVAAIEEGRASSPARTGAPQPGAVVTAQAGGQQPATQLPPIKAGDGLITHPGTYSEYRAREFVPPPATEDFNPDLTPAQQGAFADERKGLDKRAALVRTLPYAEQPKAVGEILSARAELAAKIQLAAQEKAQKAALAVTKYNETQDNAIRPRYEKEVDAYKAAAQSNLAQQQELAKIEATAKETRLTNKEQVQNGAAQDLQKDLNKETVAARDRITALEAALELSRNVKDPTLLASKSIGGIPMVDLLKGIGMGGEAFQSKLGAIQELRSGLAAVTKAMRQGVQLGTASDADLRFITSMGPNEMQDDSTREAIITNLLGQQHRKMQYGTEVSKLLAKGMNIGDAMDEAEKRVPEVTPTLPPELEKAPRGDPRVVAWFSRNVPANTIWRTEDGTRHIMHAPGWTPPQ